MCILSVWYIHSLFYPSTSFIKLSTTEYYAKDQASKEYMKERHKFKKDEGYDHALYFSKNNSVRKFGYTEYKLWATYIIQNGRKLIHVVDSYSDTILKRDLSIHSIIDSLNVDLVSLSELRKSLRNFEEDVDEFTTLMNATDINQKSNEIIAVNIIRNELNDTYQQAFTLLNTKIKEYSENKISFTNILISIVALLIALISLILSMRSNKKVA